MIIEVLYSKSAQASGSVYARRLTSNSLYKCPGELFEVYGHHGNISWTGISVALFCLSEKNKARWILREISDCELSPAGSSRCKKGQELTVTFRTSYGEYYIEPVKGTPLTHYYTVKNATFGEYCTHIPALDTETQVYGQWMCEKVSTLRNKSFSTSGKQILSDVFSRNWVPPASPDMLDYKFSTIEAWEKTR